MLEYNLCKIFVLISCGTVIIMCLNNKCIMIEWGTPKGGFRIKVRGVTKYFFGRIHPLPSIFELHWILLNREPKICEATHMAQGKSSRSVKMSKFFFCLIQHYFFIISYGYTCSLRLIENKKCRQIHIPIPVSRLETGMGIWISSLLNETRKLFRFTKCKLEFFWFTEWTSEICLVC